MQKLTVAQKMATMKNRNWRIAQPSGYSWMVFDGRGNLADISTSKSAAIHAAYEKFEASQAQDKLAKIALHVVNWKASYPNGGI